MKKVDFTYRDARNGHLKELFVQGNAAAKEHRSFKCPYARARDRIPNA